MKETQKKKIEKAVYDILSAIGEDPDREGLIETPRRVANMYEEVFKSLEEKEFTGSKVFETINGDGLVIVKDIDFFSMCEHHLLPFFGKAHVAYVPDNHQVVGLSKIPRIVDFAAKRPNLQENLTIQIADILAEKISPKGIAVLVEAEHLCMAMRGVKKLGSSTVTSTYQGIFQEDIELKRDFLRAVKD